jgi:hypothetical protein
MGGGSARVLAPSSGKAVVPAKAVGTPNGMQCEQDEQAIKRLIFRFGKKHRGT